MDTFIMLQKAAAANSEALEILEKVDGFYNNAWGMLIASTTIFGFLIPILINLVPYFNYKTLRKDLENKSKELEILKELFQESNKKNNLKYAKLNGGLFLMQGNILSKEREYLDAIASYLDSIENFIICKDDNHIRIVIKNFLDFVGNIDVELYKKFLKRNFEKINTLVEDLNQYPSLNLQDSNNFKMFIQKLTIHE